MVALLDSVGSYLIFEMVEGDGGRLKRVACLKREEGKVSLEQAEGAIVGDKEGHSYVTIISSET